jgi:hypothetical protein
VGRVEPLLQFRELVLKQAHLIVTLLQLLVECGHLLPEIHLPLGGSDLQLLQLLVQELALADP